MVTATNRMADVLRAPPGRFAAGSNRLANVFDGMRYPVALRDREEEQPKLPSVLEGTGSLMLKRCPLRRMRARDSKAALFERYAESLEFLKAQHEAAHSFFKAVLESAFEWRGSRSHSRNAAKATTREWSKLLQPLAYEPPRPLRAEMAVQAPADIYQHMKGLLIDRTRGFLQQVSQVLDDLVENEVLGLIEWFRDDPTVCRYHFFTHVVIDEEKARKSLGKEHDVKRQEDSRVVRAKHTEKETVHRSIERTHRLARHVHDLIEASSEPAARSKVTMPTKAAGIVRRCPEWLAPKLRVVTGEQIYEAVIEQDLKKEDFAEESEIVRTWEVQHVKPDPALVLGHFVLTGWS